MHLQTMKTAINVMCLRTHTLPSPSHLIRCHYSLSISGAGRVVALPLLLRRPSPGRSRSRLSCHASTFHTAAVSRYPDDNTRPPPSQEKETSEDSTIHENIYTVPNLLTTSRILACPVLGWAILQGDTYLATGILVYAGLSDWVDGYVARRYKMRSVLGTILDPAADKALVTTLTITLAMKGLLPVPLAVIILGRDVLLSISAFWWRYSSLPPPKTFTRYWDFSIPSAEVRPTEISKINTALQLLLMGVSTISPIVTFDIVWPLLALQWTVAGTTIWSGLGYLFSNNSVKIVSAAKKR